MNIYADVAQLIEHSTCNRTVGGLSPSIGFLKLLGQVSEWLKEMDCKSIDVVYGGSKPPLPIFEIILS